MLTKQGNVASVHTTEGRKFAKQDCKALCKILHVRLHGQRHAQNLFRVSQWPPKHAQTRSVSRGAVAALRQSAFDHEAFFSPPRQTFVA